MNLVMRTDRLLIRPFTEDDLDISLELFTNPAVTQYADGVMSEEEILQQLPNWTKRGGNGCVGIWTITERHTSKKIGSIALLPIPGEEDDTDYSLVVPGQMPENDIEIGYFLIPSAWGKGFASEAVGKILSFGFTDGELDEVVATFEEENDASRNVLTKAGFRNHGYRLCYGKQGPDYRITRQERQDRQKP